MNETELKLKQFFEHLYSQEIECEDIAIIEYKVNDGDHITVLIKVNTEFATSHGGKITSVNSDGFCTVLFTENPELY